MHMSAAVEPPPRSCEAPELLHSAEHAWTRSLRAARGCSFRMRDAPARISRPQLARLAEDTIAGLAAFFHAAPAHPHTTKQPTCTKLHKQPQRTRSCACCTQPGTVDACADLTLPIPSTGCCWKSLATAASRAGCTPAASPGPCLPLGAAFACWLACPAARGLVWVAAMPPAPAAAPKIQVRQPCSGSDTPTTPFQHLVRHLNGGIQGSRAICPSMSPNHPANSSKGAGMSPRLAQTGVRSMHMPATLGRHQCM